LKEEGFFAGEKGKVEDEIDVQRCQEGPTHHVAFVGVEIAHQLLAVVVDHHQK